MKNRKEGWLGVHRGVKVYTIYSALPNPCLMPWFFFNGIIALNYLSNRLTVCTCIFNVEIIIHLQKGFKLAHGRSSFLGCLPFFIAAALPQPVKLVLFLKIFLQVLTLLSRLHYQLARNGLIPLPKNLLEGKPTCCMK